MRFWVKIVVALSVVVVLGFGIWAFFFREKDDVAAYNRVSEFVDYKESLNLREKLVDLNNLDYIGKDENKVTIDDSTDTKKEILSLREITLSVDTISYYDEGGNMTCYYDSYYVLEDMSDDFIKYLLPYLKYTNANDSELRQLKSAINDYINHLKELETSIELVNTCQSSIEGSEIEYEVLLGNYNSFYVKYRRTLNDSAKVINLMIANIKSNVGSLKCDTNFALIDSYARCLNISTSVEDKREPFFAYDLHYIIDKYNRYVGGEDIYTGDYDEYQFLINYNKLINNYSDVLNKVYEKHNLEKKKIADGENLSDIKTEAQDSIITVLNVLGF